MWVGCEVECAKGVALAGHVLPQKISCTVHLQVGLQIGLLLKGGLEMCIFGSGKLCERLFRHLHCSDFKELFVLFLVHVEAGLHMLDQLHLVHLEIGTC